MPRLFVGTFLGHQDQQKVSNLQKQNEHLPKQWERKTRWVRPAKLHVTWLFLGDVDERLIPKVSIALKNTMHERRQVQHDSDSGDVIVDFNRPEVWPNSRKARVIVVESKPVPTNVEWLARRIRTNMIPFYSAQTELERNQEFKPHVTLLRLDRRIETPGEKLALHRVENRVDLRDINALDEILPIRLHVREVCLIESNLSGDEYKILDTVTLHDSSKRIRGLLD